MIGLVVMAIFLSWIALLMFAVFASMKGKPARRPELPDPKQRDSWDKSRTVRR